MLDALLVLVCSLEVRLFESSRHSVPKIESSRSKRLLLLEYVFDGMWCWELDHSTPSLESNPQALSRLSILRGVFVSKLEAGRHLGAVTEKDIKRPGRISTPSPRPRIVQSRSLLPSDYRPSAEKIQNGLLTCKSPRNFFQGWDNGKARLQ